MTILSRLLIYIASNSLNGTIPDEIKFLDSLTFLQIADDGEAGSFNPISGSIPDSMGELTKLDSLYLSGNSLDGSIPDSFYNMTSLRTLQMNHNKLSGSISSNIGKLSKLVGFYILDNSFGSSLPSEIGMLKNLCKSPRVAMDIEILLCGIE